MNKPLNYLTPFSYAKLRTALVMVGSTAIAVMDVGIRKRTGDLIDMIGAGRVSDFVFWTFILMICMYAVISFILPYNKKRLSDHIQEMMYTLLYRKALMARQTSVDAIDVGAVSTYFTSDTAGIIHYVNRMTDKAIPDIFSFVISFVAMMAIHPLIGSAAIVSAVIPVVTMYLLSRKLVEENMKYQEALQQINGHIAKYFFNIEFIKANRMEDVLERENAGLLLQLLMRKKKVAKHEALISFPMMFSSFVTILIVVLLGGFLVSRSELSIGALFTAITLVDFIVNPVMRFENTIKQIRRTQANFKRLNQYFEMADVNEVSQISVQNGNESALQIKNLKFGYSDGKRIFEDADFLWKQGNLNVLVGENGAGKSTLLKILASVYEAQDGTISITRTSKKEQNSELLSGGMIIDTQKSILFADTIYQNLTLGREIPSEKVRNICSCVGLDDEIMSMVDGYDTKLGIDGNPLSGGQKRRLCVARALLQESDIYIFDEPTAGVDQANRVLMIEAFRVLAREKLVLVISHDHELINAADTITQLEAIS